MNNAFLHGDLHEEIYMIPPPGYLPSGDKRVCRLHKSLYGLKQASREWFSKLTLALKQYGFIQSQTDTTLFTLKTNTSFLAVLVFVDDMIIVGNDSFQCQKFKQFLH